MIHMTDAEQREAARQFINKWTNGGDEKQDCHPYWLGLLQNVLGVENAIDYIQFARTLGSDPFTTDNRKYIKNRRRHIQ